MTLNGRRWRVALLSICALCALVFIANLASGSLTASEGFDFHLTPFGSLDVARVSDVAPGSPAAQSGMRNGDLIPFRALLPEDRYRLLSGVYGREHLRIVIFRDGVTRTVSYVAGPPVPQTRWDMLLGDVACAWAIAFAALLAWRRPDLPEARALSAFLALQSMNGFTAPGDWASPSLALDLAFAAFAFVTEVATVLVVVYAGLFARPLSPLRRLLAFASYVSAALAAALSLFFVIGTTFGALPAFGSSRVVNVTLAASWLFPFLALLAAVAASRGAERGRVVWTTVSLTPIMLSSIPYSFAANLLGVSGAGYSLWTQLLNVGAFLSPVGITYALFNRRLLDFNFALNRAAVYTGVSLVVVGTFVLVEYGLSEWLGAGRDANVVAGALLALGLGFSMRFIHARVDRVLDVVFFKKRHDDEHAIRDFAHEVAYISDEHVIVERIGSLLGERANAAWSHVYLVDEGGTVGPAEQNDPAIVSMRAWHKRVDLHGIKSALQGEYAYPMVARARLVGVLVVGPKRDGQAYAPDESDAISHLAHGAGLALDTLALRDERGNLIYMVRESYEKLAIAIADLRALITTRQS